MSPRNRPASVSLPHSAFGWELPLGSMALVQTHRRWMAEYSSSGLSLLRLCGQKAERHILLVTSDDH